MLQPLCYNPAIFAQERHNIGHCAQGHNLQILTVILPLQPLPQSLTQLEGHADTGQVFIRIRAVLTMRIYHRQRRRQNSAGNMMVRDDDIQFILHGRHIVHGRNATVHRDKESGTVCRYLLQSRQIKAIAFLFPMRYIKIDASPQGSQVVYHQRGGCHAVHVIVPVNHNLFAGIQRSSNAVYSLIHILQQKRVMKSLFFRV